MDGINKEQMTLKRDLVNWKISENYPERTVEEQRNRNMDKNCQT